MQLLCETLWTLLLKGSRHTVSVTHKFLNTFNALTNRSKQNNGYETNVWILVRISTLSQYFKVYLRNKQNKPHTHRYLICYLMSFIPAQQNLTVYSGSPSLLKQLSRQPIQSKVTNASKSRLFFKTKQRKPKPKHNKSTHPLQPLKKNNRVSHYLMTSNHTTDKAISA